MIGELSEGKLQFVQQYNNGKKRRLRYRERGITSYTKGRCGMCHKIRVSEVGVAYTLGKWLLKRILV